MNRNYNEKLENVSGNEAVKSIMCDKNFVSKLLSLKNIEEAKKLFSDNGMEIDYSELEHLGEYLKNTMKLANKDGKLSDSELDYVSGGVGLLVRRAGQVISTPFCLAGYVAGAIVAGFPRGIYDGFRETWYGEDDEKEANEGD